MLTATERPPTWEWSLGRIGELARLAELLFRSPSLEDFDVAVDEGHGRGGDAGDAGGLAEGERADAGEFLDDFAG